MLTQTVLDGARDQYQAYLTSKSIAVETWSTWPRQTYWPADPAVALLVLHEGDEWDAMIAGGGVLRGNPQAPQPQWDTLLVSYFLPSVVEQGSAADYAGAQQTARAAKLALANAHTLASVITLGGTVVTAGHLIRFVNPKGGPFESHPLTDRARHTWTAAVSVETRPRTAP